jgi:hypothetical protein
MSTFQNTLLLPLRAFNLVSQWKDWVWRYSYALRFRSSQKPDHVDLTWHRQYPNPRFLWNTIRQRFSNYGPRTTSGPRRVPLWPSKKDRRTNKIQMNCVSHYSWKSQSLEITHGNRLSLFLPVLKFYENYYPTRLPTTHSTLSNKRGIYVSVWGRVFITNSNKNKVPKSARCMWRLSSLPAYIQI